jgi:hypothetical protein
MTTIEMTCRYCGKDFEFKLASRVAMPKRSFMKVSCPHCRSRMALDFGVRKVGKSAQVKKQEKAQVEAAERQLQERYEATADVLVQPWSSIPKHERRNIAWKLGHRR